MFESNNVVEVANLSKAYHNKTVLNNLTLSEKRGTVFGLLGANGTRKSTTIACILGTKRAEHRTVSVLGYNPIKKRYNLFQEVGVPFQEGDYQPEIKVFELCEETVYLYQNPADWKRLCEQFGIEDKLKNTVKSLSGSKRQRLFIILALFPNPKLVFLNELTIGLDTKCTP